MQMPQQIHLISIGGAVMHNLALCLHQLGHRVSGSDDEIADPSYTRLKEAGLLPDQMGWYPERIHPELDAVILGMHARADNPELKRARELGLKVYSFPEYVYAHAADKLRVVIAGSHGKTTTTAMLMHVLKEQGMDFDYLVGSQLEGFDTMVRLSDAPLMVIEGDEYLNSVLDPRPKFLFYHAHHAQITGIAWDHINVFPSWEMYVEQFGKFIDTLPNGATLAWYSGDPVLRELVEEKGGRLEAKPYSTPEYSVQDGTVKVFFGGETYPMQVFGEHNLQNMAGAMILAEKLNITPPDFLRAMTRFTGTARRLEKIGEEGKRLIYRDFAHSPSKLKATTEAVRKQYPEHKLIASFELHTFSSLQKNFLDQYKDCLQDADEALVFYSPRVLAHKKLPALEPEEVAEAFGGAVHVLTETGALHEYLRALYRGSEKTVLLLMSSGTFEGMPLEF